MKGKRSHGVDLIDSFSIKLAGPLIEDALLHLINLSITQFKFAPNWKPQLIFPLHKKNKKEFVENYRPVSHLVEVGKLVEYAVYDQVVGHFTENQLFHENHHGSLSNHSTATALIQLVDMWIEASENTELAATLLVDQSAAYDLVDHLIFLQKLKVYKFDEATIEWFKSYLGGRSQVVQVESKQSKPSYSSDHAVPQGSILGGLIFIIFSNDFPESSTEGESVMYVDDNTDVVHDSDPHLLKQKIQHQADCSANWLADNRMCVSGDKTKLLIMGTKKLKTTRLREPIKIVVDNREVKETRSEKLLGVTINNELTWKEHLHGETWRENGDNSPGLIAQLGQRLGILKKISKYMSRTRLKMFAEGMFYSKLSYCLPVFGHVFGLERYSDTDTRSPTYTKEDNRKLQVLQNCVMRLLTNSRRETPTAELLKLTNSLSIQQMVAAQTLNMVHKVISTSKPVYLARKLRLSNVVEGRSQRMIEPIKYTRRTSQGGFVYRGSKLFNNLPLNLRSERIHKTFKISVRSWVLENIKIRP